MSVKTLWKGILSFFLGSAALAFSQEGEIQIDLAIDVWDEDEEREVLCSTFEKSLKKQLCERLRTRNLFAEREDIDPSLLDRIATLGIDIHKKGKEIFIEITCSKKSSDCEMPFFTKELHFITVEEEEDDVEEEEKSEWWWVTIDAEVLEQIEIFLNDLRRVKYF